MDQIALFKILVAGMDIGIIIWGSVVVAPVGVAMIVPRIIPVAGMEHGYMIPVKPTVGSVVVIPAGRGMIAPVAQMPFIVTVMEHGAGHGVPVNPAGAAAIVHKIHERLAIIMETGAGKVVIVNPAGVAAIVPRIKVMPAAGMEHGMVI